MSDIFVGGYIAGRTLPVCTTKFELKIVIVGLTSRNWIVLHGPAGHFNKTWGLKDFRRFVWPYLANE